MLMNQKKCSNPGCKNEVEYACKCTSPESFFCELHSGRHTKKKIAGRDHSLYFIFSEPFEDTKQAVLRFLMKEDSKYKKLKKLIIDSFYQRIANLEEDLRQYTRNLDTFSANVGNLALEIYGAEKSLESNRDSISELLTLQPEEAVNKVKSIISAEKHWYNGAKLFHIYSKDLESLIASFVNKRFQAFLNTMLSNKESSIEANTKTINSAGIKVANIKDSSSLNANENSESSKVLQNLIKFKAENESEARLLNSKINSITSDINSKLKISESQLNLMNITLRHKIAEFLSRPNNRELEMDFRATCSAYQNNSSIYHPLLAQAYQDYLNAYQQKTSLYNIDENNGRTKLTIYNTETETKEVKILQTPEPLDSGTCITQLPNGKLFCFGNYSISGITLLFDMSGRVEVLPSGAPCYWSSCIYFNNSLYRFGGYDNRNYLTLSNRFDLAQNRWIHLTPLPKADFKCNSIIFNRNILISGWDNRNLLRYSIDSNSFTTIPYEFAEKKKKILINAERLYLIEFNGSIYESEIGSDTKWKRITYSTIKYADQVYCSYNKGGIYIGVCEMSINYYFKFDLNEKRLNELSNYKMFS